VELVFEWDLLDFPVFFWYVRIIYCEDSHCIALSLACFKFFFIVLSIFESISKSSAEAYLTYKNKQAIPKSERIGV